MFDGELLGLKRPIGSSISFGGLIVLFKARLVGPANVDFPFVERIFVVKQPIQATILVESRSYLVSGANLFWIDKVGQFPVQVGSQRSRSDAH